jgi:uncharacterized protein YacL
MPESKAPSDKHSPTLWSRYWAFFAKFPWVGDSEEDIQKRFGCTNAQLITLHLIGILLALIITALWIFEPIRALPIHALFQPLLFVASTLLLRPGFMLLSQSVISLGSGEDDDGF